MIRLIDADALLRSCCSAFDEECFDPKRGYCSLEIEGKYICNAPVIDAIPVSWLKTQISEALDDNETELASDIDWLIRKYKNEQEAR